MAFNFYCSKVYQFVNKRTVSISQFEIFPITKRTVSISQFEIFPITSKKQQQKELFPLVNLKFYLLTRTVSISQFEIFPITSNKQQLEWDTVNPSCLGMHTYTIIRTFTDNKSIRPLPGTTALAGLTTLFQPHR